MDQNEPLDHWAIIKLYSAAYKKKSWIECISLGYTLLEVSLNYLLKSTACPAGRSLSDERIDEARYLIELAGIARDEGFLPAALYDEIKTFNDGRRRAIHRLRDWNVTVSELKETADLVLPLCFQLQELWLPITVTEGKPKRNA